MAKGRGFTLIELLVVAAIITILASVALPSLISSRVSSNEGAALGTLKTIINAQMAVRQTSAIDTDADGLGEFAYFAELSGRLPIRGTARFVDPPALSVKMGLVSNGVVSASGYHFRISLPGAAGAPSSEDAAGGKANLADVDPNLAETYWVCYAWPTSYEQTGKRVFVGTHPGGILESSNSTTQYSGLTSPPPPDSIFTQPNDMTSYISVRGLPGPANDGQLWFSKN